MVLNRMRDMPSSCHVDETPGSNPFRAKISSDALNGSGRSGSRAERLSPQLRSTPALLPRQGTGNGGWAMEQSDSLPVDTAAFERLDQVLEELRHATFGFCGARLRTGLLSGARWEWSRVHHRLMRTVEATEPLRPTVDELAVALLTDKSGRLRRPSRSGLGTLRGGPSRVAERRPPATRRRPHRHLARTGMRSARSVGRPHPLGGRVTATGSRLTVVGCRAGMPAPGQPSSGYLLRTSGATLLRDCGPGWPAPWAASSTRHRSMP